MGKIVQGEGEMCWVRSEARAQDKEDEGVCCVADESQSSSGQSRIPEEQDGRSAASLSNTQKIVFLLN